jgi:ribosomal protein S13
MPRIAGIDIPEKKKIRFSLRYIFGIGPKVADGILAKLGIDGERRASTLDDKEVASIAGEIDASNQRELPDDWLSGQGERILVVHGRPVNPNINTVLVSLDQEFVADRFDRDR